MNSRLALHLNLAARPLRNRRFYLSARNLLVLVIAVSAGLAVFAFVRYGLEASRLRSSIAESRQVMTDAQQEQRRLEAEVKRAEKAEASRVNLVNSIILRKTFSWTALLSELEASLPDSSYIAALTPSFAAERTVSLRIRVVSRSLEDLLTLINNLDARKFRGIRVETEARSGDGRLITELSLTYERPA